MRILCFDVGEKRIGVAVSDELGITAQGVEVIPRVNLSRDLKRIKELVERYEAQKIVLGFPVNMNGTLGQKAKELLDFKSYLEKNLSIPLETWDERLTTRAAQRALLEGNVRRAGRKKVVDMLAASLILDNYLQYQRSQNDKPRKD